MFRLLPILCALVLVAAFVGWWQYQAVVRNTAGGSSPAPSGAPGASPTPSIIPALSPSIPVFKTKAGAIVHEMLQGIVQNLLSKGPPNQLKACYDAIRR